MKYKTKKVNRMKVVQKSRGKILVYHRTGYLPQDGTYSEKV